MNNELTEMHGKAVELDAWMQRHGVDEIGPIARRNELIRLRDWKESALAVEREWDAQALAKMLGAQPGQSCRRVIQERVPDLLRQLDEAREDTQRIAVLEHTKVNVEYYTEEGASLSGPGEGAMWLVGPCGGKTLRGAIDTFRDMLREEAQDSQ